MTTLLTLDEAAWRLRATRRDVRRSALGGGCLWAFDIALPRTARRELRLALAEPPDDLWAGPPGRDLPAPELAQRWACSPRHILNLCARGALAEQRRGRRGPGGVTVVARWSALEFLRARRVGEGRLTA